MRYFSPAIRKYLKIPYVWLPVTRRNCGKVKFPGKTPKKPGHEFSLSMSRIQLSKTVMPESTLSNYGVWIANFDWVFHRFKGVLRFLCQDSQKWSKNAIWEGNTSHSFFTTCLYSLLRFKQSCNIIYFPVVISSLTKAG